MVGLNDGSDRLGCDRFHPKDAELDATIICEGRDADAGANPRNEPPLPRYRSNPMPCTCLGGVA